MTSTTIAQPPAIESALNRSDQAEAIKEAWRGGEPPDALAVLRTNPELAADKAVAIDLAYEEFCVREEAGEVIDRSAFCVQFPFGSSLRRLLTVHQFLEENPDTLPNVPATWPVPGAEISDFILVRELGRGGFSRAYLAIEKTAGNRPVVLKFSAADCREADTLGPLSHQHLAEVWSSRPIDPWNVVAMPFTGTATLEDVHSTAWGTGRGSERSPSPRSAGVILEAATRGGADDDPAFHACPPFPIHLGMRYEDGIAVIAASVFSAIAYLHAKNLAHRDVKPSNVLLGPTGYPYLLDLNLASGVADPLRLAGTLPYAAPEQLGPLTNRTLAPPTDWRPADVFSAGVVLFELLTGQHPFGDVARRSGFHGDERVPALFAAQQAGHPAIAGLNPRVSRAIRTAVERCLALDPNARPTAAELAELFSSPRQGRCHWRLAVPALAILGCLALPLAFAQLQQPVPPPAVPAPLPVAPALALLTPAPPPTTTPVVLAIPTDRMELGLLHYRKGEYSLAVGHFLTAGGARKDGRAFALAAYCFSMQKDHKDAITVANRAIELGYAPAPVYANRAYNHLRANHLPQARLDCEKALEIDPNLRAARVTRMVVLFQTYQNNKADLPPAAIQDADFVTASTPNTSDTWIAAAQLYVLASGGDVHLLDKAAWAVREAVLAGKDPGTLPQNVLLHPALNGLSLYEDALGLTPGQFQASSGVHLTSPLP